MRLSVLSRKIHYWGSLFLTLPLLIVLITGVLLQFRKQIPWVQPPETRGSGKEPTIPWTQLLESCKHAPHANIRSWDDINRLDVRPGRGIVKVWAKNSWEIQIDLKTGAVLQTAYRRSDLIESIHEGTWFGDAVKWLIFFPGSLLLFTLWATGIYLFWMPLIVKWRRRRLNKLTWPGSV